MAHIHIVVGSTLGAAEYVAEHIADQLTAAGHTHQLHNPATLHELSLTAHDVLLVVTSTHGAGDIPDNLKPFAEALATQHPDFSEVYFSVVALGDSNYDTFCEGGKYIQRLLEQCHGKQLADRFDIDVTSHDLPEDAADIWLRNWIPLLAP
ncbi:MAG: FMN-binding protein MioC [Aeromonadaceae bacterium]